MMELDRIPLQMWLAAWRSLQWYHRYTVEGLETLIATPPALIVGYHGRPFAFDMGMLTVALYDQLGYLPHGFIHRGVNDIPPLKWFTDGLGFVTGDDASLAAAVKRGEHLIVTPGGTREGCRSACQRYRVDWGDHTGYLKIALKYGLRIVPVAASGVDDLYVGLNDAHAVGRRLGLPSDWAWIPWLAFGPLGVFPFSPPFPVRIHQVIGDPIEMPRQKRLEQDALLRLHARVTDAVQRLLDRARGARKPRRRQS